MHKTRWPQRWLVAMGNLLVYCGQALGAQPRSPHPTIIPPTPSAEQEQDRAPLPDEAGASGAPAHWLALLEKAVIPLQWHGRQQTTGADSGRTIARTPLALATQVDPNPLERQAPMPTAQASTSVVGGPIVAPQKWQALASPAPLYAGDAPTPYFTAGAPVPQAEVVYAQRSPAPRFAQTPLPSSGVPVAEVQNRLMVNLADELSSERAEVNPPKPLKSAAGQTPALFTPAPPLPLAAAITDPSSIQPPIAQQQASQQLADWTAADRSTVAWTPVTVPDMLSTPGSKPITPPDPWPSAESASTVPPHNWPGAALPRWPTTDYEPLQGSMPSAQTLENLPAPATQQTARVRNAPAALSTNRDGGATRNFQPFLADQPLPLPINWPSVAHAPAHPPATQGNFAPVLSTALSSAHWPLLLDEPWESAENGDPVQERWLVQQRQRWRAEQQGRLEER